MSVTALPPLPAAHADLVRHIAHHPETPPSELFEPYRKYEATLRQYYAQEPELELLKDPHANVLPLFTNDTADIKTRARSLVAETDTEKARYVMPLPDDKRRATGSAATVGTLKEFRHNFSVFSESSLVDMPWDNVVAAGSSVVNCLLPVPDVYRASKRALREYYHEKFSPASDVDLFLYGLTEEEAVEKIKAIETSIRDSILTETTTVRTKHAITICSQYPTRHVQIVLRIYKNISEILTGFDIDCSGAAYDGTQVYCTPRALQSYMTQINHVDLTRRSPSYENRLSKYSHRGFEVYWPDLDRSRIDPTIFERSFQRTLGLARLLVLERLPTSSAREAYLDKRREERGRPRINRAFDRKLAGNIKGIHEDEVAEWVTEEDVSNYHTFTIPYGPRFHAKKIEKLCYTRDLLLNAEWNQDKERKVYLHRHPAFFGRFEDVVHDCCGFCPKPQTDEEKEIAQEESKTYVSGEVSFIKDDPGRQQIGSFNPLTDNDWTEMAYIGNTTRLCQAIVDGDLEHVQDWLAQAGADPNQRDYTGRTPLHLAALSSTPDIVKCLVEHGARLVSRLADGRTALHLAAQRGSTEIVKILLDKSAANEAEEEEKEDQRRKAVEVSPNQDSEQPDVEDDASDDASDDDTDMLDDDLDDELSDYDGETTSAGSFVKVKKTQEQDHDDIVPDAQEAEPDFYKIDVLAWDTNCSALHLAIMAGHEDVVKLLCQEYGADVLLPVKLLGYNLTYTNKPTGALLTLVLALALPIDKAKAMAKTLLELGATCAQADLFGTTAFHRYVENNEVELLDLLWALDKTGTQNALNHLAFPDERSTVAPLHAALKKGDPRIVLSLLDAGAIPQIDFETWLKSAKQVIESKLRGFEDNQKTFKTFTQQPLIVAIDSPNPEVALELIKRGADVNTITTEAHEILQRSWWRGWTKGQSALDLVRAHLGVLRKYKGEKGSNTSEPHLATGMERFLGQFQQGSWQHWMVALDIKDAKETYRKLTESYQKEELRLQSIQGIKEKAAAIKKAITILEKLESVILRKGGKTFDELHPEKKNRADTPNSEEAKKDGKYEFTFTFSGTSDLTEARKAKYIELFEAAWTGDLATIKSLTLTSPDPENSEPPLYIAVRDSKGDNPFSLAFLRGHHDVAKAILEITLAQYAPPDKSNTRFIMTKETDDESYYSDSEGISDTDEPEIYEQIVDDHFTIDNLGQVSMQVKGKVKPQEVLEYKAPTFVFSNGEIQHDSSEQISLFQFVIKRNDHRGLKFLLDMGVHVSSMKIDTEQDVAGFYHFPDDAFLYAVEVGRTELLAEIIKRTGAGLPLEELVKKSGLDLQEKPRYYQGLTVYGKKRSDWAAAGRQAVVKPAGTKVSPLLHAALAGSIESVEWFLGDAPRRHYLEFSKSKAAREDSRLKHLSQAPGGFDRTITKWLGTQNDLVIHAAVMGPTGEKSKRLIEYLVKAYPSAIDARAGDGSTPLFLASYLGRTDLIKILIDNGADQSVKDKNWNNLAHAAVACNPSADQLRTFFNLLDSDLREHLFKERNSLRVGGKTPIHKWLTGLFDMTGKPMVYRWGLPFKHKLSDEDKPYKTDDETRDVFLQLLVWSTIPVLETLDAAGDTCLHTLIAKEADSKVMQILLQHHPWLLFRENAVGRTPVEVARDTFIAERIAPPPYYRETENHSVSNMVGREPAQFVANKETRSKKEQIWDLCADFSKRVPGKRRLVSLHEANDVARRLTETHQGERYKFQTEPAQSRAGDGEKKEDTRDIVELTLPSIQKFAWKKYKEDEQSSE